MTGTPPSSTTAETAEKSEAPCFAFAWFALLASSICAGTSAAFLRHHHADSLVHSLASTLHWTPYYWDQDRLGMFYSLLAMPVRDPLWNLLLLNSLTTLAAVSSLVLVATFVLGRTQGWLVGMGAAFVLLVLTPTDAVFLTCMAHPEYLGSLAPGMLGVHWLEGGARRERTPLTWIGGLLALLVACWINIALPILLLPLVVLAEGLAPRRRNFFRPWRIVFALGFAVVFLRVLRSWLVTDGSRRTVTSLLPVDQWFEAWGRLARSTPLDLNGSRLALAILASGLAFLVCVALLRRKGQLVEGLSPIVVLLGPALAWFLTMGTLAHVAAPGYGEFSARYLIPSFAFVVLAAVALPMRTLLLFLPARLESRLLAGTALLWFAACVMRCGLPEEDAVLEAFEERLGPASHELIALDCTHVTGHYWHTMDVVYYVNLLRHRSGHTEPVFPHTDRSRPLRFLWAERDPASLRFGQASSYDWGEDMYGLNREASYPVLDPIPVESTERVRVLRVTNGAPSR